MLRVQTLATSRLSNFASGWHDGVPLFPKFNMFWFDIPADVYRIHENMNESCDRAMRKKNSIEFIMQYI